MVTSAFQAERKSYPVRWLIVVITLLSTFLLLIFCIVFYDRSKGFFRRETEKSSVAPIQASEDQENQERDADHTTPQPNSENNTNNNG